jgi:hypothetical protein
MQRFIPLAAAAMLGLAPAAAFAAPDQQPQVTPDSASIPDGTIGKAGAALHDVAKLQEKYQGRMESASPEQKQGISQQANAEAMQAIQSHGISVQDYSNVIRTAQANPQVKQRLLDAANLRN